MMNRRWIPIAALLSLVVAVSLAAQAADGTPVEMKASDGTAITGKLWGKGETGLVLCHGRAYTKGAASFDQECRYLSHKGIACLALNFRGYPGDAPAPSMEGQDLDVLAAFEHLASQGAKRIYVLGSSMGGFAVLKALERLSEKPHFAGIIILSAFAQTPSMPAVGGRKLFVVAEDDKRLYPNVLRTFIRASGPKHCIVFDRGGHGQQLFQARRIELLEQIRLFVTTGGEGGS